MSSSEDQKRTIAEGFRSPNYTPVPDELFDELLVELSGAELKGAALHRPAHLRLQARQRQHQPLADAPGAFGPATGACSIEA